MKITKFVHACVLVEDDGQAMLFDPGGFSWQSGLVDVNALPELTAIAVTHKHGDHMDESFVRALVERFSDIQWFAPSDAHDDLRSWGVVNVTNQSMQDVEVTEGEHAPVEPFGAQVSNLQVCWRGKVTHPGDSHEFAYQAPVLLLPVQAPWGSTVHAFRLVQELQPAHVVPIHDWMWNDQWCQHVYNRLEAVFQDSATSVHRPTNGRPIEIHD